MFYEHFSFLWQYHLQINGCMFWNIIGKNFFSNNHVHFPSCKCTGLCPFLSIFYCIDIAVIKCCLNFFPESNYFQKRARLQSQPIQQSGPQLSLSSPLLNNGRKTIMKGNGKGVFLLIIKPFEKTSKVDSNVEFL